MKKRKITFILLLCMIMASLAGCGKSAAEENVKVESPSSDADKMKKYDPEITLTFAKAEVVTNYPEGQNAQNNAMYQMWEDVMGIKVENSILCASNAMTEKFQLAVASDEIPDFGIVDATTLASLIKNDMVTDMTDIYKEWATDNLKEVAGQQDNALFAPTVKDGRYMAIPVANTVGDSYPILWMRKDWLDALGLEEPKTMEQVFDIAEKFALSDPDGNGKDDTYGLYLDKDLNGLDFIMAAYEVYSKDEYWVKQEDGSFIAGCTAPDAKKPLGALAKLYEEGAIDHEFAVKEQSKEEELIASGQIGIYIGYFYSPLGVMKDSVANTGADWVAVPMPAAEGYSDYKPGVNLNVYGYIYAKKGISNPEAIVVMLNHLCDGYAAPWLADGTSEFYERYNELASDPEISQAGANNLMPFQMAGNINWGEKFTEAIAAGEEHVDGKDADFQNVISTELPAELSWAWKKVYLEGYLVMDLDNVRYSDYTGAPTETMSKTQSLLKTQKLTDYISIIMGDQPVDYFDTFAETFNNIGGAKIGEEIKEALQ